MYTKVFTLILLLLAALNIHSQSGAIDVTFNPGDLGFGKGDGVTPNDVMAISVTPDGKILIGGQFFNYNGTSRHRIAKLNADGSLDAGFDPGTGVSNTVNAMRIQPDGKILIAGSFTEYNGTLRNRIARLNADGSLDAGFDPGTGADNTVYSLNVQPDGKIIIGGALRVTTAQVATASHD